MDSCQENNTKGQTYQGMECRQTDPLMTFSKTCIMQDKHKIEIEQNTPE